MFTVTTEDLIATIAWYRRNGTDKAAHDEALTEYQKRCGNDGSWID